MKNPFAVILVIAALFFAAGGNSWLLIPAIIFFIISSTGNKKNKQQRNQPRNRGRNYNPRRRQQGQQDDRRRQYQERRRPSPPPRTRQQPVSRPKPNPYKKSGVMKYKDFDYEGAIEDFKKAVEIDANDIPTHFNLACSYSLTEQKELAYKHIDHAVKLGFKEVAKIKTHDAFAFIRIQSDFETFEKNGFRLTSKMDIPQEADEKVDPLLLERLKKLAELRDRGILTEAEFLIQKEKLIR